jgi:hypothetical protein
MNKFLTILPPLLLVMASSAVGWSAMSEDNSSSSVGSPPVPQTFSGLPAILEYSRFAALGKKSPFTLASSTGELADFAKDLYLAGFARMAGEEYVVVANKTKPDRVLVGKKPSPSAQEMVLVEVKKDPSGDAAKMEARIKKGGEVATLKYEVFGGGEAPGVPPVVAGQPGAPAPLPPNATGVPAQPSQTTPSQAAAGSGPKLPTRTRYRVTPVPLPKLGR